MNELAPQPEHLPRPNYSFEQLEAAIDVAPLISIEEVGEEYTQVGKMMLDRTSDYLIFVNENGMFIKSLVRR